VWKQAGPRDGALQKYFGKGIYKEKGVHLKKICEGFPLYLHWKFFKTALTIDIKQRSSRHYRRRRRYRRRHRRSESKVEKKMKR
jgi:hypothetical protein